MNACPSATDPAAMLGNYADDFTLASNPMRRLPFASAVALILVLLSAASLTFALGSTFFSSHPSWSTREAVGEFAQGIAIMYGPFVLISALILICKNSVTISAVAVLVAAATFVASYSGDKTGTLLFLNAVLSWLLGIVAIVVALVKLSRASTARAMPDNSTAETDAKLPPI